MSIKVRSTLHSLVIIAVLIFGAAGTTIAYADGGTDTAPTQTQGSDSTTVTTPTPEPPAYGNPQSVHKINKKVKSAVDATNLNNVPADTTVQVVNADGQAESLASQAAADAIATTSDPIWCPAGQAPTPGANGCTSSFSSFTALLTFLSGNATYQGNGTIYVQQGAYTGGESSVNFNNYNLSNISSAA